MIQGKCPQCGQLYYGYALLQPENQTCDNCGDKLSITRGYSTFTGQPYEIHLSAKINGLSNQLNKKATI